MKSTLQFSEQLLRAVSQLEVHARRNIGAFLTGTYRTVFRGSGMQFKEFRNYAPGDDIRHMSWPVTARTRRATVKVYEEERELDILIMVDVSGSSLFGTRNKRKLDMYSELLALLGLAAIKSGDSAGALLFADDISLYLSPKRSRNQVLNALLQFLSQPFSLKQSDLRPAFEYAQNVLLNRSLIIVISDFLLPSFEEELLRLSRRHEVVLLHCYDDAEKGVGINGIHEICDPETGDYLLLDANSRKTLDAMAKHHVALSSRLEDIARSSKADYLCLSVEDDYLQKLIHFFHSRGPSSL